MPGNDRLVPAAAAAAPPPPPPTPPLRPWNSDRLRALIASSPPAAISTNPNPRDCPVSRSITTWALVTFPCWPNSCSRSADVVENARLPTYRFLLTSDSPAGNRPRRNGPTALEAGAGGLGWGAWRGGALAVTAAVAGGVLRGRGRSALP